jgi:hypothetical protein
LRFLVRVIGFRDLNWKSQRLSLGAGLFRLSSDELGVAAVFFDILEVVSRALLRAVTE